MSCKIASNRAVAPFADNVHQGENSRRDADRREGGRRRKDDTHRIAGCWAHRPDSRAQCRGAYEARRSSPSPMRCRKRPPRSRRRRVRGTMPVDALIASQEIDAVMICTSTDTHADLIERVAKTGKSIFCEKPVDLSAKRIASTLRKVEKAKVKLMIGFNRRFDPNFAAAQATARQGRDRRGRDRHNSVARFRPAADRLRETLGRPFPRHDGA